MRLEHLTKYFLAQIFFFFFSLFKKKNFFWFGSILKKFFSKKAMEDVLSSIDYGRTKRPPSRIPTNVGIDTVEISSISSVVCQIGCRVRQPTQETFRPAIFLSCDFCSSAVAKLGSPLSNLSRQKVSTCRCEPIPQSRSLDIA